VTHEEHRVRIAYVLETWLPSTDGIVTRMTATIRELVERGHEVLVIAPRASRRLRGHSELVGVTVRTVPSVGFPFIYGGQRWGLPGPLVARLISGFDPAVVHVVNPAWLGVAGVIAARWQRRPLVASYHTDLTQHAPHYHLGWLTPLIWGLLRLLHNRATLNLATSQAAIRNLETHGIPGARLWPRGVDLELFRSKTQRRAAARSRPVALYVGRLAGEKGLDRLAPLAHPDSGVDLVLVGDGPQRLELMHSFPSPTVSFPGILHGLSLAEAYRKADVFVFPSTTETLGLVLLEALASGLPVVAAESPASRELLGDCPAARLFPPDEPEQILTLTRELSAASLDCSLAQAARRQVLPWTWGRATTILLSYYDTAIVLSRRT
jgi:glycosyltransferase involved in cell wall biosynthesis